MSYRCEKCDVFVQVFGCRWCRDCYPTESRKFMLEQRRKKEEFDEMTKRGTEAWEDVPANFVDDLRGGEE